MSIPMCVTHEMDVRSSGIAVTANLADAVVERCIAGEVSPAIAIAQILVGSGDVTSVERAVETAGERLSHAHGVDSTALMAGERLDAMRSLLRDVTPGCARIAATLIHTDPTVLSSPQHGVASSNTIDRCRTFFDDLVQQSEEASVALYSLGNPALLRRASEEIVAVLDAWHTVPSDAVVLDIGCGIGRLEQLLSGRVAEIHAIDVSPGMIEVARRRCTGLGNVHFSTSSGRDLSAFADQSFDLVLAVDSFPYLYGSGVALVEAHFGEAHRVLRSGGHFVILNLSYRGDPETDRNDVYRLARDCGFDVIACGVRPFTFWDGLAFHLRRSGATA